MGATIRREPVNFDIPSSPNYKFLNITNFRGLDISNNPFELATNTASDCLNVYVDETNTLTTRPRLQKKYLDLLKKLQGDTVLGIYPISKGYLLHTVTSTNSYYIAFFDGKKVVYITATQDEVPKNAFKIFEQNDKVYILDGVKYLVIDFNSGTVPDIDIVKGYVPTTSVVRLDGTRKEVEHINLLSDEKKELYFWDGVSDLNIIDYPKKTTYKNNYFVKQEYSLSNSDFKRYYSDFTALGLTDTLDSLIYYNLKPSYDGAREKTINKWSDFVHNTELEEVAIASQAKSIWSFYRGDNKTECRFGTYDEQTRDMIFTTKDLEGLYVWRIYGMSPNGRYCLCDLNNDFVMFDSMTLDYIKVPFLTYGAHTVTNNGDVYALNITSNQVSIEKWLYGAETKEYLSHIKPLKEATQDNTTIRAFEDRLIVITSNRVATYYNFSDINAKIVDFPDEVNVNYLFSTGTGAYVLRNDTNQLYIISDLTDVNKIYNTHFNLGSDVPEYIIENVGLFVSPSLIYVWNNSSEAQITATTLLSNEEMDLLSEKRQHLLQSKLVTRFDNNYWFANGNEYYRSQNNDPTYFPITEYNSLGDVNEHITGFNISNDSSLLVYKENGLYLIQPYYSEATASTEYSVTESKNTVGNTAIGAPIVTTLTEIPLQINYDGIYGLSQLKNVSAVERIADLMSEPINERWLNEDDKVIKNAQTLNRLYWTYVILPCDDKTKVYLLDNRTNSWYYWELPIKVINSFIKDNVTELVDVNGDIYYLTSDDIENTNFDSVLVTEYYDYGKKLIPWYWQSQILYLGTMNYSKRLVNTTFILTDTDTQDGYGLQYSFKVFRKLASSIPEKEISGDLTLVRSTTKKTNISKFGFIQLKISNITEESQGTEADKAFRNNKLRLVGLGLKYVLLEGLIR